MQQTLKKIIQIKINELEEKTELLNETISKLIDLNETQKEKIYTQSIDFFRLLRIKTKQQIKLLKNIL